jgi:membrane protein
MVIVLATAIAVTTVGPWIAEITGSSAAGSIARFLTWLLAGVAFVTALAVLYRVGPDRDDPEWKWVSVGSVLAMVLWLTASIFFRLYVANFGSYNETYGSLAAVVILLLWLYITCFVILLGAEVNAELEHQTAKDTTVGPDEPMGERGATMADTLGEAAGRDR